MPTPPAVPAFAPLYLQIKALLEKSLEAREWRPGETIPSEIELARRYRVSQGTVRKAIDALADDNLVVRRQGKGTFVATHTEERSSLFRFLRIRRNDGGDVAPLSRLLDVRRAKAGQGQGFELGHGSVGSRRGGGLCMAGPVLSSAGCGSEACICYGHIARQFMPRQRSAMTTAAFWAGQRRAACQTDAGPEAARDDTG